MSAGWEALRNRILDPEPLLDGDRPAGVVRSLPEDFRVDEIPAYPPDGGEGHLFLLLEKRGWNTEGALREVAGQLGLPRAEIGLAGLKDRHAVTRQWISLPAAALGRLADFTHPDIRLGEAHPHSHKLRRGHLRANTFRLVVRELDRPADLAALEVGGRLRRLEEQGGMGHLFGPQRFGWDGRNVEIGLGLLAKPWRIRPADLALSALQAALFNACWLLRRDRGLLDTVLEGDVLRKSATGGLFTSQDPGVDQERLDAGELQLTGPIFGADRLLPPQGTPAGRLEEEVLELFGTPRAAWQALGKKAPGTRRNLRTRPEQVAVAPGRQEDGDLAALVLEFTLEAGAFATRLLGELLVWREAGQEREGGEA